MDNQTEINERMRAILVDWLIEVHLKFKLKRETLFICINIFDRYISNIYALKSTLQLQGVACLMIACKFEEIYQPEVKDYIYITDNAYSKSLLLAEESRILTTLDFDLNFPSPTTFLDSHFERLGNDDLLRQYSYYLLDASLLDINMNYYPSSILGAAALTLAYQKA